MENAKMNSLIAQYPLVEDLVALKETTWFNPGTTSLAEGLPYVGLTEQDVQDAHEAIRPSYVEMDPESIRDSLSKDQYNLYRLIWSRFMASQMSPARFKGVSASIVNGDYGFKATGSKLVFEGYLKVYASSKDDQL